MTLEKFSFFVVLFVKTSKLLDKNDYNSKHKKW